jgi:hypothetical protein
VPIQKSFNLKSCVVILRHVVQARERRGEKHLDKSAQRDHATALEHRRDMAECAVWNAELIQPGHLRADGTLCFLRQM